MIVKSLLSCLCVAALATVASAGVINVSNIGGGISLNSGPLASGAFGGGRSIWSSTSLAAVHASINASGITTNGRITFVAADTSDGLSFMALIDQELVEGLGNLGHVHMDSVANGNNLAFLKDTAGNITVSPVDPDARIASGTFAWNSNGGGDAFAWAGLETGNTVTFRYNKVLGQFMGLNAISTFQFLTWTGTNWAEVSVPGSLLSFSDAGDFGFAATVQVPTPSVIIVAGFPILGGALIRRRRTS